MCIIADAFLSCCERPYSLLVEQSLSYDYNSVLWEIRNVNNYKPSIKYLVFFLNKIYYS